MDLSNQNPFVQGALSGGKPNPFPKDSIEWKLYEDGARTAAPKASVPEPKQEVKPETQPSAEPRNMFQNRDKKI